MKKTTLFIALLSTILATNSLQAMHNSNNKRIKDEEQSDVNNKYIKLTIDNNSENKQAVIQTNTQKNLKEEEIHNTSKEEPKNLTIPSSNTQLPSQQYQISTYPQYNINVRTTNNVVFNIQPVPILNFVPTYYPLRLPFLMPNNQTPRQQPNLHKINMDHVKQYLANNQHITQNKQQDYQEKINYSDTYIFDLKETNAINTICNEVIKPITDVKSVTFKMLPSLQQLEFLSKKFPCTQKIDASALFGEGFSNIHLDLNKKEKIFYKFRQTIESLKEKASKNYQNEPLALTDIKCCVLNYISNAYTDEPQKPCDYLNTLLNCEQISNQHLNNNPHYTNNNNNTTQTFSQKPYIHTNVKQSTHTSQPKKPLPITQNTNILRNFQQIPIKNIASKSPFVENNNNAQNLNTQKATPLFDTNKFIDSILENPIPMDDFSDLTSETQSDLDFFYSNDAPNLPLADSTITNNNHYAIQDGTVLIFDINERKCLAQKIALPPEDKINTLCFKICPTELEFFELSEFFYNVQKIDFSFVLKSDISNIKSILQSLKTFEHLKELKLEGNELTDEVILWISKELPCLEKLILDNNFISDKGAEAITHLYHLKELSIHSNQLTGRGIIKIAEMPNLAIFNYDNNSISEADKKAIYAIRKEVLFLHNAD